MRRLLIAIAILAVTALPSFAAGPSEMPGGAPAMGPAGGHRGMTREMMANPQHLLMRAYHKNVMIFGETLATVARQGETVPREVARVAIAEMRRSVEEMEKYRAESMKTMPPAFAGNVEMQKRMDEHLVNVKTQLRQLDELAKSDRIPSQEVLKHLQLLFQGCQEMGQGMGHRGGMHCGEMHRDHGMHGCGCDEMAAMTPERRQMMEEMMQKVKAQDAEMARQVEKMKAAPRDGKIDIMANVVAQLVQQRAEMTAHMEKMQRHLLEGPHGGPGMFHQCAPMPPPPMVRGEGPYDEDSNDMEMDEVTEY